jgi:hypothetical protein
MLNKHTIRGKKGETVYYTIPNFTLEDSIIKWDPFKFYTPVGDQTEDGFTYFNVPSEQILIERDDTLDKEFIIIITKDQAVEFIEILEGAESGTIQIGLEGDIVASGFIPANPAEEINIDYKEVSDG